jgi:hypothetical protein
LSDTLYTPPGTYDAPYVPTTTGGDVPRGTVHGGRRRRGRAARVGLWLLVALLIVLVAGGLGVAFRLSGLWPGAGADPSGSASPSESAVAAGSATFRTDDFTLTHPEEWNAVCPSDYADGRCYFDRMTPDQHSEGNAALARNPYVLVIVGDARGLSAEEQLRAEDAVARSRPRTFGDYTPTPVQETTVGDHDGARLTYTYTSRATNALMRVRIFRFVEDDRYYEVSLRSPASRFAGYLDGFQQIATSIQPVE